MGDCHDNFSQQQPEQEEPISFLQAVRDMCVFSRPMINDELKECWNNLSHKTAHEFGCNAGTQLMARLAASDIDDVY